MQRKATRLFVFLAVTSIIGMVTVQAYWFHQAFDIRKEGFILKVKIALNKVAQRIAGYNQHQLPTGNLVEQASLNSFQVLINQPINTSLLPELIRQEFEQQQIKIDFEYAIYDCNDNSLSLGEKVCMDEECETIPTNKASIPIEMVDQNYFLVQLPDSIHTILVSMEIWLFSTVVLIIVILFFAYALFFILKQKKLSEIQTDFINNMSHEFQTPISSILLSGNALQLKAVLENPEKIKLYGKLICKEGKRLKSNVESILNQADGEKYQLTAEVCSIHVLINEVVDAIKLLQPTSEISCQLDAKNHLLEIDKLHIYNVLQNILENCVKYASDKPVVLIKTYNIESKLYVSIADKGIGISDKYQKKVFKKFFRIPDKEIQLKKGFGLGLYYVKNIIKAHKGNIELQSILNKGTTITLGLNLPTS